MRARPGLYVVGPFHDERGPHGGLRYTLALRRDLDTGLASVSVAMKGQNPKTVPLGFMGDREALAVFSRFIADFHLRERY